MGKVERFTGKRSGSTIHDYMDLHKAIEELSCLDKPAAFAGAIVSEDGKFRTRFVILPKASKAELLGSLEILKRDLLESILEDI